jgi:hypothetical protein
MVRVVYVLITLASLFFAGLVIRNYRRTRVRLAYWTSLCFAGLALHNSAQLVNLLVPSVDLGLWRTLIALTAVSTLLFGLIWEER